MIFRSVCLGLAFTLWLGLSSGLADTRQRRIVVDLSQQRLKLFEGSAVLADYPVSTSRFGAGSREGSFQTPLGKHRISQKIGAGAPIGTIFKDRVSTGRRAVVNRSLEPSEEDSITTRILWLSGLEPGRNAGGSVDSHGRMIYIHGTPDEGLIGRPASRGCVRMKDLDVADLFDRVEVGSVVEIRA